MQHPAQPLLKPAPFSWVLLTALSGPRAGAADPTRYSPLPSSIRRWSQSTLEEVKSGEPA